MRSRVDRLSVDIDLIDDNDSMLAAAGACIAAGFDFQADRSQQTDSDVAGRITTSLTHPGVFVPTLLARLVILEATLSDATPDQVLALVRQRIPEPDRRIGTVELVRTEGTANSQE